MHLLWLGCTVCHPFLTIFWFSFLFWLAPLRGWALLDGGLCFSLAHPFFCYHLQPYRSIIPAAKLFALNLLGLFGLAVYSSPNGPIRPLVLLLHHWWAPMSHLFSFGCPWPICFPSASLALFLTLHSHGLLLSSLSFSSQSYYPLSLRLMDLLSTSYFLCFHYFGPILTFSYHILPMVCFFFFFFFLSLSRLL